MGESFKNRDNENENLFSEFSPADEKLQETKRDALSQGFVNPETGAEIKTNETEEAATALRKHKIMKGSIKKPDYKKQQEDFEKKFGKR
jgi:hypothetical protein